MRFHLSLAFLGLALAVGAARASGARDVTADFLLEPPSRVTVYAASPLVKKPEGVGVDAQGRVWVLDDGKALRLVDKDGDGAADSVEAVSPAPPLLRPLVDSFGNGWTQPPAGAASALPLLVTPPATATNHPCRGLALYEGELPGWDALFWGLLTAEPELGRIRNIRPTNQTAIAHSVALPFVAARTNASGAFRPVDLAVGAAGELYVADASGRILRFEPPRMTNRFSPPDLGTTNGFVAALSSPAPAVWWSAVEAAPRLGTNGMKAISHTFQDNFSAALRARSMQAAARFGQRSSAFLRKGLSARDPNIRLIALRMARGTLTNWFDLTQRMGAGEPALTVRQEYERCLRDLPAEQTVPILVRLMNYVTTWSPPGPEERDAVLYAAQGREAALADALSQTNASRHTDLIQRLRQK